MRVFLFVALSLVLTPDLSAQSDAGRPDFTGIWKLTEETADFREPLPNLVQSIVHRGSTFEITVMEDGVVRVPRETYVIGAPDSRRPSSCCGDGDGRYWWEGSALHGTFVWALGSQLDVRTLSSDGKTMKVVRTIQQTSERFIVWVFEKQ